MPRKRNWVWSGKQRKIADYLQSAAFDLKVDYVAGEGLTTRDLRTTGFRTRCLSGRSNKKALVAQSPSNRRRKRGRGGKEQRLHKYQEQLQCCSHVFVQLLWNYNIVGMLTNWASWIDRVVACCGSEKEFKLISICSLYAVKPTRQLSLSASKRKPSTASYQITSIQLMSYLNML